MKKKALIKEFSRLIRKQCFLCFLIAAVLLALPSICYGVFLSEVVDSAGDVGKHASIALDSSDRLHISYYDSTNGALKYATDASGTWVTVSVVDANLGPYIDARTTIIIDSAEKVHISYWDYSNNELKHVTNRDVAPGAGNCTNTDWNCETVDSFVGTGVGYPSIGTDSSDRIHISYSTNTRVLQYATNRGVTPGSGNCTNTDWDCETVDNAGYTYWTSLAIDSSDRVHISYSGYGTFVLRYATNRSVVPGAGNCTSTDWDCETVNSAYVFNFTSIAIDSLNNVHISYSDYNASKIMHATNRGVTPGAGTCTNTDWNCEIVNSAVLSYGTSIAVDSSDDVHVSFAPSGPWYATNASGSWESEPVDSASGWYPAIAIDSEDKAHIVYPDNANVDLRHAEDDSGSWVAETVNTVSPNYFRGPSITTDSLRNVHISYYILWGGVMYATDRDVIPGSGTCTSTDWQCELEYYMAFGHTSIATDSTDKVHMSYSYNWGSGSIYYATNRNVPSGSGNCFNSDWNCELIDAGLYPSLAIDPSDAIHIVYFDTGAAELDLRYATNHGVSPGTGNCTSTDFNCETVDSTGDVGREADLAIDSLGKLHVSYYDATNQALRYATTSGVSPGSGNCTNTDWDCGTVDTGLGSYGDWYRTSIAVDSVGRAHISYYDATNYDLRYATNSGITPGLGNCTNTDWDCETVDSAGGVGAYSSIAIDSFDKVHISYYNRLSTYDHYLKYATNAYGSWITWMQHPVGDRGFTSIATDSCDNVHIATDGVTYVSHVLDTDDDGIRNDGDYTCLEDDNPCTGGETIACDDNCPDTPNPGQEDYDGDLVGDACDNCREVENWDQRDSNYPEDDNTAMSGMQHYGDICDPDYDNDGLVKLSDFSVWRLWFRNTCPPAPEYVDHIPDGLIKLSDFSIWRKYFRGPPGPGIGD